MVKKHEFTEQDKTLIHRALNDAGVKSPCSRCNCPDFTLLNNYVNAGIMPHFVNEYYSKIIPAVITICAQCGNMNQHSVEALKLTPPKTRPDTELTEQEKKVAKLMGVTQDAYLKNKNLNNGFGPPKRPPLIFEHDEIKKTNNFYPETKSNSFLGRLFDKLGL